ncbi:selenoprotein S-like [Haliotis rubra]|uniref:selenoprotein S-like n=1 Tax=Haliotis rubra TaxID=36100 RepID=UPI001EE5A658|nr:selenoprotein S-like [Haliotis rubra]
MGDVGGDGNPHPEVLRNENPALVSNVFSTGVEVIQTYGWFLLAGVLLPFYLRKKFQASWDKMQKSREEESYKKLTFFFIDQVLVPNVGVAQSRHEAMEQSRQRMQEQLNAQAEEYAEKQRKKEEEKRKQKIEDWDRHLEGKGYRSRYKPRHKVNPEICK